MREEESFIFIADNEKRELQDKKIPVVNAMEKMGLPSRPEMHAAELSGNEAVREHLEPLRHKDAPLILYGVPHSGEMVPQKLYDGFADEGRETVVMTDLGTLAIFRSEKIGSIEFMMSRYVTDPNRAPDFTSDIELQKGKAPGKILWREGANFKPMYQEGKEPTEEEVRQYAEQFYLPYYNKMMSAIGTLLDHREDPSQRVLVLDGHSFPVTENLKAYYNHYGIEKPEELPMFVLGDRDGAGCDPDIMDAFAASLERHFDELPDEQQNVLKHLIKGKVVGRNEYLKGVHNVTFWGARDKGVNAIQIECNESAYVDRPSGEWKDFHYNEEKMALMQSLIEKATLDVDTILKNK